MGKTRLAARFAEQLAERGAEVVAVALEGTQTAEDFRAALGGALGLQLADNSAEAIARHLASRDVTLLLDNFEQLVESGAPVLASLLAAAPGLRLVVTSREVLGLREEWIVAIEGLSCEEDGGRDEADAVSLFLDREMQASGGRSAADADVREICALVEGMPLALELAAALRRYLSRSQIAASLREGESILSSGLRNVPERHRTVTGLFQESCRHLTAPQVGTLLGLSVFEGMFTLEDALHVTGTTAGAIGDLVDRSLVQAHDSQFALHSLLRQYARERAGRELDRYRRSHAEYFLSFMAERRQRLEWDDQRAAAAEVDLRRQNVLAAWRWACGEGRFDLVDRAAYPLFLYAQLRSRWAEVRPAIELAVGALEREGDDQWAILGPLLVFQTWARIRTSLGPEVVESYQRAEELYRRHDASPPPGLGTDTVAMRALLYWGRGQYGRLSEAAEQARLRAEAREDDLGEAYALWLGAVARNREARLRWEPGADAVSGAYHPADGEAEASLREAQWLLDRATTLLARKGERAFRANILYEQAWNAKALGDVGRAIRLARQCYETRSEFGDLRGVADALMDLTGSYLLAGDPDQAVVSCREAEPIVGRLGDQGGAAELERTRALLARGLGDGETAIARAARSAEISLQIGSVNNVLGSIRLLADALLDRGEAETATEVHALVAAHPASPPFARAQAEAALEREAALLPADQFAALRERGRAARIDEFTSTLLARFARPLPGEE